MKYSITLCDDNLVQIDILKDYINALSKELDLKFDILTSNSGEELVAKLQSSPLFTENSNEMPIFFLDVEMNGMNGLELGNELRERYKNSIIVFITGFPGYAVDAFNMRAFHYILKPISYESFRKLFLDILDCIKEKKCFQLQERQFIIENKDSIHKIPCSNIYYFEKCLRKIKVCYSKGLQEFYGSFKTLKQNLDSSSFFQCHQGFIINIHKITSYHNQEVYLKELEKPIPVSKSNIKAVREMLVKQLFE